MTIFRRGHPNGGECKGYEKITIFDQYRCLSRNWCKIEPSLQWKANRKPHPSFWMVPFWMTSSELWLGFQGHDIIQRQITRKWYNVELWLQWPTNRKSYMIYRTAPFSMTLNDPYARFQGHAIFWRWIYKYNTNKIYIAPGILKRIGAQTHGVTRR